MGRARTITPEQVRQAMDRLRAEGRHPGIVAVKALIGGSYDVVKALMAEVQAEDVAAADGAPVNGEVQTPDGLPPEVTAVVHGLVAAWRSLADAERRRADEIATAAQRHADERVRLAEDRARAVGVALAETETQLAEASAERDRLARRLAAVEREADRLRGQVEAMKGAPAPAPSAPSVDAPRPAAYRAKPSVDARRDDAAIARARELRAEGMAMAAIAERMAAEGRPVSKSWVQKWAGGSAPDA